MSKDEIKENPLRPSSSRAILPKVRGGRVPLRLGGTLLRGNFGLCPPVCRGTLSGVRYEELIL